MSIAYAEFPVNDFEIHAYSFQASVLPVRPDLNSRAQFRNLRTVPQSHKTLLPVCFPPYADNNPVRFCHFSFVLRYIPAMPGQKVNDTNRGHPVVGKSHSPYFLSSAFTAVNFRLLCLIFAPCNVPTLPSVKLILNFPMFSPFFFQLCNFLREICMKQSFSCPNR